MSEPFSIFSPDCPCHRCAEAAALHVKMNSNALIRGLKDDRRWFAANPLRRWRCRDPLRGEFPDHLRKKGMRPVIITERLSAANREGHGFRYRRMRCIALTSLPNTDYEISRLLDPAAPTIH
jgi:hypothetical protein